MGKGGNAVGANTWEADELGNWGLGRFRRLEDSGDWDVREIGRFGRLGKIVICGRSEKRWRGEHVGSRRIGKLGAWEIQVIGRFGRLGGSGDWEIRETGRFGRAGSSGDWGKSLYVAKIKNLLEPRKTREIGRYRRFGRFGRFRRFGRFGRLGKFGRFERLGGNHYMWRKLRTSWNPGEFGSLEDWEVWEIGNFRRLGDWKIWRFGRLGKIVICGKK